METTGKSLAELVKRGDIKPFKAGTEEIGALLEVKTAKRFLGFVRARIGGK